MIALMGIKHCGKSTVGKILADVTGAPFFDIDDEIEQVSGMSFRELYATKGKDAFMLAEAAACRAVLERGGSDAVIATGGGICDNEAALAELKAAGCRFVYLAIDEKTACDRILDEAEKTGSLPAYIQKEHPANEQDVRAVFNAFYRRRTKAYEALCDATVNVSGKRAEVIADEIRSLSL